MGAMGQNITLACVYKTGGDFTAEYVNRLAESLAPFGPLHVLTDSNEPMDAIAIKLEQGYPGWWSKMELFRRFCVGKTIYFDLDTVIKGDISPLFELPHPFYMLSDFYKPEQEASGVMVWDGNFDYLSSGFTMDKAARYNVPARWYDQGYIRDNLQITPKRLQDALPGFFASYKADSVETRKAASVVCFHGKPRPADVGWRAY